MAVRREEGQKWMRHRETEQTRRLLGEGRQQGEGEMEWLDEGRRESMERPMDRDGNHERWLGEVKGRSESMQSSRRGDEAWFDQGQGERGEGSSDVQKHMARDRDGVLVEVRSMWQKSEKEDWPEGMRGEFGM